MKLDSYNLIARAFPAVLSIPPFFILYYFLLRPLIGNFIGELLTIKITSDITLPIVLFFLLMQLNRIVSKEIFEKRIFKDGLYFPTTNFLLHLNSYYTPRYTKKIHAKIKSDFGIDIPSKIAEIQDSEYTRRSIVEAVSHIRIKVGKGFLLGQHNSEYGFVRNFSGGNIIATVVSLLNIIIFLWIYPVNLALLMSCITFSSYLILSLFGKKMIISMGNNYAKVLIQEYMSTTE